MAGPAGVSTRTVQPAQPPTAQAMNSSSDGPPPYTGAWSKYGRNSRIASWEFGRMNTCPPSPTIACCGGPWPMFYSDKFSVTGSQVTPLFAFWDYSGSSDMEKLGPLLRIADYQA